MTCRKVIDEFLMDYISGELAYRQRLSFVFHLLICRKCRAYLKSYRETVKLGKAVFTDPEAPVPAEVPEELVRAILSSRGSVDSGDHPS
jgi:anti-sigma factor RsiW